MSHLTAAEPHRHLDAIAVLQELLCVLDLDVEIADVDAGGHADLLDLSYMLILLGFFLFFGLLEAELAIVDDLAHRRGGVGRDLHQIQSLIVGHIQSGLGSHNAKLFTIGTDDTDFLISDVLIELMVLFADMKHLQHKKRMPQRHPQQYTMIPWNLMPIYRFALLAVRAGPPLLLPFAR